MKKFNFGAMFTSILFAVVAILGIFGIAGWILNIVELTRMSEGMSNMFIIRVVGIFIAPMGSVLGFM